MSIGKPEGKRVAVAIGVRGMTLTCVACVCALIGGLSLGSAPALACPNEELHTGPSAGLPDCRAYEMVSPAAKNGYFPALGAQEPASAWAQVSPTGGALAYVANGPFPGSATNATADFYLATRGEAGWSTQALLPPQAFSYNQRLVNPTFAAFSPDLSKAILLDATDSPALVSGEPATTANETANLFLRDNTTGAYSLLNVAAPGLDPLPSEPVFDGASSDYNTVIFNEDAALTPEALGSGADNLYASTAGALSLVSQIPPAGEPSCGPAGPACIPVAHAKFGVENADPGAENQGSLVRAISSDGSRIFFTADGELYVREDGAMTVQVDAPAPGGAGPGGGGVWTTAAAEGSEVFFYDEASAGLTGSTVPGSGRNLYSYDTENGTLTDLTPDPQAGVMGVVGEASEDGSYIYFVATGVLTTEKNSLEQQAQAGGENLYLSHDGAISFIHTVSDTSHAIYSNSYHNFHGAARVTPDGRHLAFFAEDRGEFHSNPLFAELFEYSADFGQVDHLCACAGSVFTQQEWNAYPFKQQGGLFQYNHALSDDGTRVFFDSVEALLPRDTNGRRDVYEYEQDGVGSCNVASGCLYLISSGTSSEDSSFVEATASGNDVFFTTGQQLVPTDVDAAYDLYDARVDGGFASPPSPAACLGDACQPAPQVVNDPTPASFTFSGAGNLPPAPAVKPAGKSSTPKKKSKPKRKKKRSHKGQAKTGRAGNQRRAGT
jgi:hypothetical protein